MPLVVCVEETYQGDFSKPTAIIQVLNSTFLCPRKLFLSLSCPLPRPSPLLCFYSYLILSFRHASGQTLSAFFQKNRIYQVPTLRQDRAQGKVVSVLTESRRNDGHTKQST